MQRGRAHDATSPWPSLPAKPSPHVKSCPIAVTAAMWNGPQDTWRQRRFLALSGALPEQLEACWRWQQAPRCNILKSEERHQPDCLCCFCTKERTFPVRIQLEPRTDSERRPAGRGAARLADPLKSHHLGDDMVRQQAADLAGDVLPGGVLVAQVPP